MKLLCIVFIAICFSCGGSLSSEQRKKMRENMEAKAIKKISDAELTEGALSYSRNIAKIISEGDESRAFLDSLEKVYKVQIISMNLNDPELRGIERKIIEAYASAPGTAKLSDNLQKVGNDSLVYTKPLMKERPDGSLEFSRALGLRMSKRTVILSIKE